MSNQVTYHSDVCGTEQQSESGDELSEFYKILSTNYDVLPLFERQYSDFIGTKLYSMRTNEKLRKRWQDRVRGNPEKVGLRTMPTISDFHFHNCRIKLLSSESPANFPTLRRHLAPGPGVDKFGPRPIPDDMMFRKPDHKVSSPSIKNKSKTRTRDQKNPVKL